MLSIRIYVITSYSIHYTKLYEGNVKTNIEKKLNIGTNIKGTLKKGSNALPNKYMHLLSLDELSDIATRNNFV